MLLSRQIKLIQNVYLILWRKYGDPSSALIPEMHLQPLFDNCLVQLRNNISIDFQKISAITKYFQYRNNTVISIYLLCDKW